MMLNCDGVGCQLMMIMLRLRNAPVAQLDRAAASEAVGQKFESSRAHHILLPQRVGSNTDERNFGEAPLGDNEGMANSLSAAFLADSLGQSEAKRRTAEINGPIEAGSCARKFPYFRILHRTHD